MSDCPTDSREEIFLHTIVKELRAVTVKLSASEAIAEKMAEALERVTENFQRAVRGAPVRDMAETLAEVKQALTAYEQEK